MTAPQQFEHDVRAFLAEGPSELSDRTYDAVRAGIDQSRQRVVIGPWRTTDVNTYFKLAAGFAAVLVVALVGANLLTTEPVPGNLASPSPSLIATPTAPIAEPTAGTVQTRTGELPPSGTVLSGSGYAFYGDAGERTVRIGFSGADGWLSRMWYVTSPEDDPLQAAIAAWGYGAIANVYPDPCNPDPGAAAIGPSVDDLVAALLAQDHRTSSPPIDITISGFTGKQIDSTIGGVDVSTCAAERLNLWQVKGGAGRWITEQPMVQRLFILDVDGIRVLVEGSYPVGGPEARVRAIMSSLDVSIDPPPTG